MLIWSGYGILIPLIVMLCCLFAGIPFAATKNPLLAFGPGLILSGVVLWYYGPYLIRTRSRVLVDPESGEPVVFRPGTSLFFIPMRGWAPICVIAGVILLALGLIVQFGGPPKAKQGKAEPAQLQAK